MKIQSITASALCLLLASVASAQQGPSLGQTTTNLGMIGLKSFAGRYLQAHIPSGEMHASNPNRNQEETWFLIEVDKNRHLYALQNWRSGGYMSSQRECAPAPRGNQLGPNETWEIQSARRFGHPNDVIIVNANNHKMLGTNGPDDDYPGCGGEVTARDDTNFWSDARIRQEISQNGRFGGLWTIEPASAPEPGKDLWNTVGNVFQGIFNKIDPVDVAALLLLI